MSADVGSGTENCPRIIDRHRRIRGVRLVSCGRGLGGTSLGRDLNEAKDVVSVNVTGTILLIQKVGEQTRYRGKWRIHLHPAGGVFLGTN